MRKPAAFLTTVAVVGGLALSSLSALPAAALTPGVAFGAADLSTWQTNGIVYGVGSIKGKVIAGGTFSQISPPVGGTGTARAQSALAIFNAETGAPDACQFSMALSGGTPSVRAVVASPDGNTIYIGGNFSNVGGVNVARVAAIDPVTCTVKALRVSSISSQVLGLVATPSTLYLAGEFLTVGGQTRNRFAAVNATTGALLPFAPQADGIGRAVAVSPDGSKVAIGGDFFTVNGQDSHALAVVNATTGATIRSYAADHNDRSALTYDSSVIKTIITDGTTFYTGSEGTGGGVFDGRTALSWDTLDQRWRDTCLGATQATVVYQGTLYSASHAHDCGSNNAFPDGKRNFFLAETTNNATILQWFPTANDGIGEGIGPRALTVATGATTGKKYLWYGGEFTQVNGHTQQALTRFGPDDTTVPPTPVIAAEALTSNAIQVRFRTVVDPDDGPLTYSLYRNGGTTPIWTGTASSTWWSRPQVTIIDTNVTPGTLYTYQVRASDGRNTSALSGSVGARAVTKSANYSSTVIADGASLYWRFDETSGTWVQDKSGATTTTGLNGLYQKGVTLGAPGAIVGDADTAAIFNGTNGYVYSDQNRPGPTTYSVETWIKTTTTTGGKIVGYGNGRPKTNSGDASLSGNYDRHIYMDNSGRLTFGVWTGSAQTVRSANPYNDGKWHQIVATQGSDGMKLYVDGVRVGQNGNTSAQDYSGNWHVGGDNLYGWPNQPAGPYFSGAIDDTSIYAKVLSPQQITNHFSLAGGAVTTSAVPADAYGATVFNDNPDVYWRLDEASGTAVKDSSTYGQSTGLYGSGDTLAQAPAITTGKSIATDGTPSGTVATVNSSGGPAQLSEEAWFKTNTTSGGKLLGFEDTATGTGNNYDKQTYMTNDGRLIFGVYVGGVHYIETTASYNDNKWHHVVGTIGANGMKLYVDGVIVGTEPTTSSQSFDGYWRAGGGNLNGWPDQPANAFFAGSLDEVAFYSTELSAASVTSHFQLGSNTSTDTQAPTAPTNVAATVTGNTAAVSWTASTDNVGVTGYSVYRGTSAAFAADAASKVADTSSTSYSDAGLATGTYYYRVTAKDASGNLSAASSASAAAAVGDNTAPSTPQSLSATASGGSVSLTWTASTDNVAVTGYSVHRSTTSGFTAGASNKIADVTSTSYTDSSPAAGTYYYRVIAVDGAANASAASDAASATVQGTVTPTIVTLNPTEDAMVYQVLPTTNFGADQQLSSRGAATNSTIASYLKFTIPATPAGKTLTGARIQLRTSTDTTAGSVDAHQLAIVTGTWAEGTVTWNTRPTGAGAVLGTLTGATATNTSYSVTLDAAALAAGAGTSISIAITSSGSDNVRLWSNNATQSTYRPLITLTYSN